MFIPLLKIREMENRETLAIEREKILERIKKILEFDLYNDDKFFEENKDTLIDLFVEYRQNQRKINAIVGTEVLAHFGIKDNTDNPFKY